MTQKLVLHLDNKTIVIEVMMVISLTKTTLIDCTKELTPAMGLLADGLVVVVTMSVEILLEEIVLDARSNIVATAATEETECQTIQQTLMLMPLGRKKKTSDSRRRLALISRNT